MLVFIDESGDTGRKITQGSSKYFVVSLVLFDDHKTALECDKRIEDLRRSLKKDLRFEFHFQSNSHAVRQRFLKCISPFHFTFYSIVIDKNPKKLIGKGFEVKESFYKYACNLLFSNAKHIINNATVVIDKSGSPEFQKSLKKYLNKILSDNHNSNKIIKKLKQQHSHTNNLLQLADYVSGIINRKYQNKKDWKMYYLSIKNKEQRVQLWPK